MHRQKTANVRTVLRIAAFCSLGWFCSNSPKGDESEKSQVPPILQALMPIYSYHIVDSYPHDARAFTQGLAIADGALYESTGLYGESSLRRVDLATGDVLQERSLPDSLFGEGIAIWNERIIQVTWRARVGLVYDRRSFELLKQFRYHTEGWGLTHDGDRLILSDGSSTLYFIDPDSFAELGRVAVFDTDGPVTLLNELEYIGGEVFANILQSDRIARIDPRSGKVTGWIDLGGLLAEVPGTNSAGVLNGIAYDEVENRLYVTGKNWPQLFEIELR
jgi:glutamine cyclotransferase